MADFLSAEWFEHINTQLGRHEVPDTSTWRVVLSWPDGPSSLPHAITMACTNGVASIERGDHLIIVIDSIGNAASKKEVDDALDGKSAADMTRAKAMKSLFRMITPHLTLKDIPMVVVNHTYMEIGMFPKAIVGGGTGSYYSADAIWILGRQQEKDADGISGYHFVINVEKSRYVKEKSKIPITVSHNGGISKWSGLLELALESKHVIKPSIGWYSKVNLETGEVEDKKYRIKYTETKEFWMPVLQTKSFYEFVKNKYSVGQVEMVSDASMDKALAELEHEE